MRVNKYSLMLVREKAGDFKDECAFATTVTHPSDLYNSMSHLFDGADRELFVVVALNTRNKIIGFNTVSVGTIDSSLVHPREVFKFAVASSASSIILFHNHPSGDTEPSSEDINITKRLVDCGELIGIPVLDHVIAGEDGRWLSLKVRNLM
jgi:DNA repair protein RadC